MSPTESIWRQHHARLHSFIQSRVGDPSVADDILQDVFLRIHSRIDSLKESGKIQSWIYQIARNAIIDHYRAHRRMEELPETLVAPETEDDGDAWREIGGCLRPMVESLPEPYRQAVIMSELVGMTQKEVAEEQGISFSGAKSRVQRGRKMVKDMLLQCCRFEFDNRGTITDYESKREGCGKC
ncbi:MAG: RNA polymerase sigma factor SigZ [Candidatus Latescibacteria bacterium]|nr:RNA polymerase sigma factor SigZ [Candidatus Latescibacterota bacterium]